tara:strand:+ start:211 stop:864 length:654 start_codon:yes stop_codon:yes gene_type:complete
MKAVEVEQELSAIEREAKQISKGFYEVFKGHGIGEGQQNNFWMIISGSLELYDTDRINLRSLLGYWSRGYSGREKHLSEYIEKIKELTKRIYTRDRNAEHILKRLRGLLTRKGKKVEDKTIYLLESIKQKAAALLTEAEALQRMIDALKKHAKGLNKKLGKPNTNLEKLKDREFKYAESIRERMIRTGRRGWDKVCRIYSEDKKAETLFHEIKSDLT